MREQVHARRRIALLIVQNTDQQFNVRRIRFSLAQRNTRFMSDVTELTQARFIDLSPGTEDSGEDEIENINQRSLAAKVQRQRLRFAVRSFDRRGHLGKDIHVGAAEAVNRLLTIADDE